MINGFEGQEELKEKLREKTIFISGGTGSVGQAVLKRLLGYAVSEIRIFSRDESKQYAMQHTFFDERISYFLGDLKDKESLMYAMDGVDIVIHTAALKQVPLCELNPLEAVKTNIMGTDNLISVAASCKVSKIIYLSSDKAVNPSCTMGLTKKLEETICISKSQNLSPVICGVRFGNILFSKGSVIPVFVNQINLGQKVTITDPGMTRFIMSIDEAVDLVLYALLHGKSGELYVKRCNTCSVDSLVQAISRIYSEKYQGSKIIGIRKNEKLHETLIAEEEIPLVDAKDPVFLCINYFMTPNTGDNAMKEYSSNSEEGLGVEELKELLLEYIQ